MFRVLFVCTGNICRSPMGELLLRDGLNDRLGDDSSDFVVASAGTFGLADHPLEELASRTLLEHHNIVGDTFRAKKLEAFMVDGADLVLTATREHRAAAVTLSPKAVRRTFTIREFDRLSAAVDPATLPETGPIERARALVAAAASQRGLVRADKPSDDDIIDPYRGPLDGFVDCAVLIKSTLQGPMDLIAG
ncbi:MAG: putative protein-tyrosine phosphatase [Frankiales bacterium]|nr:putative protein-tyrosine phosphatase [Frankiales bacterium]